MGLLKQVYDGVFNSNSTEDVFHSTGTFSWVRLRLKRCEPMSPTQVVHTGLKDSGTDALWTCILFWFSLCSSFFT
ncbi:hypothetical protein ILYODFUR_031598 [Ilyodon furcidens]|uniref:Uncharacterized protein n=1 Tax=Ilyodon furcidens TaxID=33524 RepID=A0ABV0TSI5_9TELE